ncbi:MAG: hypothetical protein ACRDMZ_00760 [Solirubrobacteraceae bacterium]
MADERALPYRYDVTLTIEMVGDGIHADGEGATATLRRVRDLVAADRNVRDVQAGAVQVLWEGRAWTID